jgi:hypothetical protein
MSDLRHLQLVELLLKKTKARELQWEQTTGSNTFHAPFANFVVTISHRVGLSRYDPGEEERIREGKLTYSQSLYHSK